MGVRLPNEAQAYGYYVAHRERCKPPVMLDGDWVVPDGNSAVVNAAPLTWKPSGPPSPGSSAERAKVKPWERKNIKPRLIGKANNTEEGARA